jgi:16S rRNA (guanine(527)-N(7))-methyltransferase RsmG
MFAAHAIPELHGRLADVGSGPGFPGLALKILRPSLEVFLIEAVMKKATFLAEVTRHLSLTGVKVVVSRFEDLADDLAPLDFICARALGDREALLNWATHNLNISGRVVLWLGADAGDLAPSDLHSSSPGQLLQAQSRSHVTIRETLVGASGVGGPEHAPGKAANFDQAERWTWAPPIPIPDSTNRYLVVGKSLIQRP